jgi:YesN/AraC family two-component response regulator
MTKKILIVEDDEVIRELMTDAINDLYCDIIAHEADNGISALSLIANNDYDYILTDINMPKMDGFTLIKKLREEKNNSIIAILSGRMDNEEKANKLGVKFYLKPVNFEVVLSDLLGM